LEQRHKKAPKKLPNFLTSHSSFRLLQSNKIPLCETCHTFNFHETGFLSFLTYFIINWPSTHPSTVQKSKGMQIKKAKSTSLISSKNDTFVKSKKKTFNINQKKFSKNGYEVSHSKKNKNKSFTLVYLTCQSKI